MISLTFVSLSKIAGPIFLSMSITMKSGWFLKKRRVFWTVKMCVDGLVIFIMYSKFNFNWYLSQMSLFSYLYWRQVVPNQNSWIFFYCMPFAFIQLISRADVPSEFVTLNHYNASNRTLRTSLYFFIGVDGIVFWGLFFINYD